MSDAAPVAAPAAPAGGAPAPGEGQPGAAPKSGETTAQAQSRRLKLMMDGQEVELDESEVVTNYRKGRDASKLLSKVDQRRQEALKAKAEADGLLAKLQNKGNVRQVLRELGYSTEDLRAMSNAEILEAIEEEKLTPDQRRARELEQKLKGYEDEKQKAERQKQEAAHAAEVEKHTDELANLFLGAMESLGLPQASGRHVLPRIARLWMQNEEAGMNTSLEEVTAYVAEGLRKEHRGVLSGLEGEALVQHLGEDVVKKVLSVHLARIRQKRGIQPAAPREQTFQPPAQKPPASGRAARVGWRWDHIEKIANGG